MSTFEALKSSTKMALVSQREASSEVQNPEICEISTKILVPVQHSYEPVIVINGYTALPPFYESVENTKQTIDLGNGQTIRWSVVQGLQTFWKNPVIQSNCLTPVYYSDHGDTKAIFDSCHRASDTRDVSIERVTKQEAQHRSPKELLDIPHDIDDELFASMGIGAYVEKQQHAPPFSQIDQTPYVHFGASNIQEKTIGENGQVIITPGLLERIWEAGSNSIVYRNLMRWWGITDYKPSQCDEKRRIRYDARIYSRSTAFIPVDSKDDMWTLEAGAASGVTQGSIWELYEAPTEISRSIGRFEVSNISVSEATLEPLDPDIKWPMSEKDEDSRLYARCVRIGQEDQLVVKVWMSLDDQKILFPGSSQHVGGSHESGLGYIMTSARDTADVVLEVHHPHLDAPTGATKPEVVFSWCDDVTKKYKATKLGHRIPASRDKVEAILFAAARWRWHLGYTNASKKSAQSVTMNMLKVANRTGVLSKPLRKPESMAVNRSSIVEFVVDNTSLYGFKLKSKTRSPLYIRMFYFDTADFSIGDMFGCATGLGESAFNIAPGGELLIGDGVDGGSPIRFSISSGNPAEVGYMKVFWSTSPLELDHIKQQSAFNSRPGDARGVFVDTFDSDNEWGTVTLPLVLREQV